MLTDFLETFLLFLEVFWIVLNFSRLIASVRSDVVRDPLTARFLDQNFYDRSARTDVSARRSLDYIIL